MQFPPSYRHFIPLWSKHSLQRTVLKQTPSVCEIDTTKESTETSLTEVELWIWKKKAEEKPERQGHVGFVVSKVALGQATDRPTDRPRLSTTRKASVTALWMAHH
jgi:hypothetical protein